MQTEQNLTPKQAKRARIRKQKAAKKAAQIAFTETAKDQTVQEISRNLRRWMIFSLWSVLANVVLVILVAVLAVKAAQCGA